MKKVSATEKLIISESENTKVITVIKFNIVNDMYFEKQTSS